MDAILEKVPEIDPLRIGVTGCSRWGKAALAAGIFDERVRSVLLWWDVQMFCLLMTFCRYSSAYLCLPVLKESDLGASSSKRVSENSAKTQARNMEGMLIKMLPMIKRRCE